MTLISDNIKANEELYHNIEIIQRVTYRRDRTVEPRMDALVVDYEGKHRCVLQKSLIYLNESTKQELVSGEHQDASTLQGYDGQLTRRIEHMTSSKAKEKLSPIVNIYHERFADARLFVAHRWLLSGAGITTPVSTWLLAGQVLASAPNAGPYESTWYGKSSFETNEIVDGMPCAKIRFDTLDRDGKGRLITLRYVWFATRRNYLPVKTEAYDAALSLKVPVESASASDFREISPGVWLPFHKSIKVFNRYIDEFRTKARLVVSNVTEARLEKAVLDPSYHISFFRDIPIPDGATVYHVKDGESDAGQVNPEEKSGKGLLWFLICNAVVLTLATALWAIRRRANIRLASVNAEKQN